MAGKSFALATLAGGITLFLLGYVFYGLLLVNFFESNATAAGAAVMMAEPMMLGIFLSNLVYAAFLTLVLGSWAKVSSAGDGLNKGAMVGLLVGLSMNLIWHSIADMQTLTAHLVDAVVGAVMAGVAGAVIAVVVSKTSATA